MEHPYLGHVLNAHRALTVEVPGAFVVACHERWRTYPSLRDAARRISVLSVEEQRRRSRANGFKIDKSGLAVSYQTIAHLDREARTIPTPTTVTMGAVLYFLLCHWMGLAPALPDEGPLRALYRLWKLYYDAEITRKKEPTHA